MRKSSIYFIFTAGTLGLFTILAVHAGYRRATALPELTQRSTLAKKLLLTDLCLFTEARYTRHPALADLHSPFQEHPVALEHFPSGSLVTPPSFITRPHVKHPSAP